MLMRLNIHFVSLRATPTVQNKFIQTILIYMLFSRNIQCRNVLFKYRIM